MIRYRSIADGLAQDSDNFLLLRFMAVAAVIYGHAPAITGGPAPKDPFVWLGWGSYSGAIAVDLFFAVSGFLVAGSWQRRRNLVDFAWARALRVVPAYAACLAACALLVGPLFTKLPLAEYFRDPGTLRYRSDYYGVYLWEFPAQQMVAAVVAVAAERVVRFRDRAAARDRFLASAGTAGLEAEELAREAAGALAATRRGRADRRRGRRHENGSHAVARRSRRSPAAPGFVVGPQYGDTVSHAAPFGPFAMRRRTRPALSARPVDCNAVAPPAMRR